MKIFNRPEQKRLRSNLRINSTEPERRLWARLRAGQLGVKFRRQQGVGRYIADFYCVDARLVVELDGASHYQDAAQEYDQIRDAYMQSCGLRVLRFLNSEVMQNMDVVVAQIVQAIDGGREK